MTIQKFEGNTKEEAIELAKATLGDNVVIMNVKNIRPGGLFGVFKKGSVEVTVAIEDDAMMMKAQRAASVPIASGEKLVAAASAPVSAIEQHRRKPAVEEESKNFTAVADEEITIPPVGSVESTPSRRAREAAPTYKKPAPALSASKQDEAAVDAEALRSVFKEVNEVIAGATTIPVTAVTDYDPTSKIIHADQIKTPEPPRAPEAPRGKAPAKIVEFPGNPVDHTNRFVRMVYNTLVDNEVDEHYVNSLLSDLSDVLTEDASMDSQLSSIYQKMILQLGNIQTITIGKNRPSVVFLIGPTGVGKTTTIAKLASQFKLREKTNVALITSDTYRIAAQEQLSTYAGIIGAPIATLYEPSDLPGLLKQYSKYDIVLVDTVGFSHMNTSQRDALKDLLAAIPAEYYKEIYLVLSATTKYKDLKAIVDAYSDFTDFSLIFTKLDETGYYGNIYNIRKYADAPLSYITNGQDAARDISVLDPQKLVTRLMGGS